MTPYLRWMVKADLPEVARIEAASFAEPWGVEQFEQSLRNRTTVGVVAESSSGLAGFVLYSTGDVEFTVLGLAVAPWARRVGVGRSLLERVKDKVRSGGRRRRVTIYERESNLASQLFLRACGFRASLVRRGFYGDEDAYVFQYRVRRAAGSAA